MLTRVGLAAQAAVVVRGAGERGEYLAAVDAPAAVDPLRRGRKGRPAGRAVIGAALGEGLGVERAVLDDTPVVQRAAAPMRLPDLGVHAEIVGQRTRPQAAPAILVP